MSTGTSGRAAAVLTGDLEKHGRGGVFYLHGEDEFRKEEVAAALVQAHLDPATADFNFDRLSGSDVDVETLASILATPPMVAEWRVVLLRETEALASSSKARDLLVTTAGSPPPGLALVLVCTVPSGSRARFYRDLGRAARARAFESISPNDVPQWLMARSEEAHGVVMEESAARALAGAVGTELGVLAREVDKLASVVEEGAAIDLAAVEAAGTQLPKQDRWSWFELAGGRGFGEAVSSLSTLLGQQGESGVGLVIGLATHLLRLGVVRAEGLRGLEAALPGRQKWLAQRDRGRDFERQARMWHDGELESAIEGLLRIDRLLKSSGLSEESLLEEWLLTEFARSGMDIRSDGRVA